MAMFIAKQMVGSKLDSVKGMAGGGDKGADAGGGGDGEPTEEEIAAAEARAEEAEKRRRKFAKMEEDREKTRVTIREKYNIKKLDESNPYGFVLPDLPDMPEGGMNAKKKTPAELQAEIDAAGEFNPIKMATNLFGTVKTGFEKIPFPWKSS